ncbi:MAG: hypothetical protein NXH90_01890 [Flavobacteriaceae bacterium]|nr:hypothetical protein [Flavobacteriaceae bacterium]
MLASYDVDSPAKLDYDQKVEFFTRIKKDWKIKKILITKNEAKQVVPAQKALYTTVNVPRPSIPVEPKQDYIKAFMSKSMENDFNAIKSEPNPDQTDNLTINFNPNQFFEQEKEYSYPVVKMPKEGSLLKLPRKGRAMGKGYKEKDFHKAIAENLPKIEVATDLHLTIPFFNKPYEPDIVLIDKKLNLFIDIEIDEPYDGYYRFPTHEYNYDDKGIVTKKDQIRDLFFTESGWIVIRFTEKQVHLQEQECVAYINDVLNSIYNYKMEVSSNCYSESQWDYQQAIRWQKNNYRENYLGIEKFGKQQPKSVVIVDVDETEGIEINLNRLETFNQPNLQDNIGFEEETHKYHHPKNKTGNADYISVTTLIDRFFPFDMNAFIHRKAKKEGVSEIDILTEFIKNRDEAAEKGTYLHTQIENFLKGKKYDDKSKEFTMFKQFYQKVVLGQGFVFVEAEKRVLLEEYNIAGTVDAIFKKPNKNEYLIVDWKRSKKLLIDGHPKKYGFGHALSELCNLDNSSYYKYALQQNIYKYILENNYKMPISSMNLIVLHESFNQYYRINLPNMDKEISIIFNSINHKI